MTGTETFHLADLFEAVADAVGDRVAVVAGDRRLTYAELEDRSNRLADHLRSQGIGPGDHVGLYLSNDAAFVEALLAAFKLRAVPVNVNHRYVEEELAYLFADAELVAVVHHRRFAPALEAIRTRTPRLRHLLAVDDGSGADCSGVGSVDYEQALRAASPTRSFEPRSGDDHYVLYTGGTTGMPKGVVWRHEDIYLGVLVQAVGDPPESPAVAVERAVAGGEAVVVLPACPLMHGAGQWAALGAILGGGRLVLSVAHGLDPHDIWRLVESEGVVALTVVGDAITRPLVDALREASGRFDLSSLVFVSSGGGILSPGVRESFRPTSPAPSSWTASAAPRPAGRPHPSGRGTASPSASSRPPPPPCSTPSCAPYARDQESWAAWRRPVGSRSVTTGTRRRRRRPSSRSTACAGCCPATWQPSKPTAPSRCWGEGPW